MDEFLVGSFMEFTGVASPEDAAQHLDSCGWNLDEAVNLFFSIGAGPSGTRCSPSPPRGQDAVVVRPPIPARSDTLYGRTGSSSLSGSSRRQSRWDRETGVSSSNSRRRCRRRDRENEEDSRRRQCRRVGRNDDDDTRVEEDECLNNNSKEKAKDLEELFRPPRELTFQGGGGLNEAKAHAARRGRWLLVNVQDAGAFATLTQNRDVWRSDLVARYVRAHFVLWQVDTGGGEEARKVCCWYKLPLDRLPAVVVVDPVTGQAMAKLHGASTDPNDFLVAVRPYIASKPVVPVAGVEHASSAAEPPVHHQELATTTSPTTSPQCREKQAPRVEFLQDKAVTVAVAPPTVQPAPVPAPAPAPAPPVEDKQVCKLRIRLPGGRVVTKEFGSGSAVAALFAYCRSELGEGEAGKKPFRLMRMVGSTREEINDPSASFGNTGLHLSTVSVLVG